MTLRSILVGMDFSECALSALSYAGMLARYFKADLHILNVAPAEDGDRHSGEFPFSRGDLSERLGDAAGNSREINLFVSMGNHETYQATPTSPDSSQAVLRVIQAQRFDDSPASGMLDYANEQNADLIVLGTHGRSGLDRILLGSVAEEIARRSTRPVLTVRNRDDSHAHLPVRRILIPIDFSPISTGLLVRASEIAKQSGATLDLLHVIEDVRIPDVYGIAPLTVAVPDIFARSKVALRKLFEDTIHEAVPCEMHVTSGRPHERILNFAATQESDLIVIGAYIHPDLSHYLLGRVSERIIRIAPCPVLSLRGSNES